MGTKLVCWGFNYRGHGGFHREDRELKVINSEIPLCVLCVFFFVSFVVKTRKQKETRSIASLQLIFLRDPEQAALQTFVDA